MASAISENAEALQIRKTAAEAIREENDALAHELVALRASGAVVQSIPLEQIHTVVTGDEGVTLLVFRVHEKGKPERMPAE